MKRLLKSAGMINFNSSPARHGTMGNRVCREGLAWGVRLACPYISHPDYGNGLCSDMYLPASCPVSQKKSPSRCLTGLGLDTFLLLYRC